MKFYAYIDTAALSMLYTECKAIGKDVTITMVHSEKYGDYAIVATYRLDIDVIKLIDKVGLKEKERRTK